MCWFNVGPASTSDFVGVVAGEHGTCNWRRAHTLFSSPHLIIIFFGLWLAISGAAGATYNHWEWFLPSFSFAGR